MGLYAIAIRDTKAASEIPTILKQHGYNVWFKGENERASLYACLARHGELMFSISKDTPQRFSTSVGRESHELVRILDEHGVFAELDDSGRADA